MKSILIILLVTVFGLSAFTQFQYTIKSSPDSAVVLVNGEVECATPCRVKYYWKDKKNNMMVFTVNASGYDSWSDTILHKPSKFDRTATLELKPSVSKLTFDSINPLIGFDKLLAIFEDGEQVGSYTNLDGKVEPVIWEGSVKLGNSSFEKSFYQRMTDYGFETPIKKGSKLFSDSENQRMLPRYTIGAQIVGYDIQINETDDKSFGAGKLLVKIRLKIEWKVFDKSIDEVVYTYINEGVVRKREWYSTSGKDIALHAFDMALIDFAENSDFYSLIKSRKDSRIDTHIITEKKAIQLSVVKSMEFGKLSEMIQYCSKACVTIVTDAGHGSGAFIGKDGYIVTANHVVQDVNKIDIIMSNGVELAAQVISSDLANDVALLKVAGSGFQPLSISTEMIGLGEEVITIGTPADIEFGQSVSKGMISGKRIVEGQDYIQIDMSVSPGNSGGPLLNSNGEVIGIVRSKIIGNGIEGIGFAIPIKSVIESLGIIYE